MDWGLKNRLSKIIQPDTGRAVMLAFDHGYFLGPTHRLEEPEKTITPLIPYADTIMLTREEAYSGPLSTLKPIQT